MGSKLKLSLTSLVAPAIGIAVVQIASSAYGQPSAAIETSPSYEAWRESAQLLGDLRLTYGYQRTPAPEFVSRTLDNAGTKERSPELRRILSAIGTRAEGVLKVSRKGNSLEREETLERFENQPRVWKFTIGSDDHYPAEPDTSGSYIRIHGDGIYFVDSYERKTGAIWPEWERETDYPIVRVVPPDPETASLQAVSETGIVLDFVTNYNDLFRYELDPDSGMMPVRIEYFDILEDGKLFLYRYFTVEKYIQTENGAFLPAESTLHDFAKQEDDGTIRSDLRNTFTMKAYEENVQFAETEFTHEFPLGTRVTDNISKTRYIVGNERERRPVQRSNEVDLFKEKS